MLLTDEAKEGCRRSLALRERRLPKMLAAKDAQHVIAHIVVHHSSEVRVLGQQRHKMAPMLS